MKDEKHSQLSTPDEIDEKLYSQLKDIAHWYGGWDAVREIIKTLEENDQEKAYEKHCTDY